ncbi:hypothetical protein EGY05_06255 [Chryseobacterium arthrosphaerae]|uniref:carboxypeptidase-like regulatory domain-containing protein n=1 Tax=Chryseobacterium arthrosphaerae TaxID=651561 RepID=UPI000F4F4B87|nr:carboxypeptidase-like regulatory domain-containing protein [Chryseobacterium arthrosphaerae]AYZ11546.1 hypothetical protein EGY05_06255 [Chryseobacterium arthrosphaerae]MDG4653231.1 carboxypeptidase-like regulatory domain-containing protein [Chryseobacterium arthrosphaerae]
MKSIKILFIVLSLLPFHDLTGQILKGKITDEKTAKPLAGALITFKRVDDNVTGKISANDKGVYQLPESFEKGNYEFEISLKGYKTKSFCVLFRKDTVLDIPMALNADEKKFD